MKRWRILIASVLSTVMLLTTVPLSTAAAWLGDIARDDNVNMRDCMLLYQVVSKGVSVDAEAALLGDIDESGAINMRDCMLLYKTVSTGLALKEISLSSEQPTLTPVDPAAYYGRTLLAAQGDKYVQAYDYLGEQINALNTDISLYQFRLTLAEFERVLSHYRDDHPEVFWINRTYGYYYFTQNDTQYIYSMQQQYLYTDGEIRSYQVMIDNCAQTYLEGITDEMPKAQREKLIHDRVVLGASYDTTYAADHTRDLLGVLAYGTGVCESYSRAMQYLLHQSGIRCALVTGTADTGESHMWNVVELEDGWYQMDATWNDPVFSSPIPDYCTYTYYNVTTEQITLDRAIEAVYSNFDKTYAISYEAPLCTATAQNYQMQTATELTAFDAATVGAVIAQSIQDNTVAIFRPTGGYTLADLTADMKVSKNYWAVIDIVNVLLPDDAQLTTPGYVLKTGQSTGIYEIYLRNM